LRRAAISIAAGISISALLAAWEASYPSLLSRFLQTPGGLTVMWMWGVHGSPNQNETAMEIAMVSVNALVYTLIGFGLLSLCRYPKIR
jgi:hypothetical protein